MIGMCQERHRHQEWLKFLRVIDDVTPADKQIFLIADNYSTHKHVKVQRWLERAHVSTCTSHRPAHPG